MLGRRDRDVFSVPREVVLARQLLTLMGIYGRHALDGLLWAADSEHEPERTDATHAMAQYWELDTASESLRVDRVDPDAIEDESLRAWVSVIREHQVACPLDLMVLAPYTE